jgi:hypothetical protein
MAKHQPCASPYLRAPRNFFRQSLVGSDEIFPTASSQPACCTRAPIASVLTFPFPKTTPITNHARRHNFDLPFALKPAPGLPASRVFDRARTGDRRCLAAESVGISVSLQPRSMHGFSPCLKSPKPPNANTRSVAAPRKRQPPNERRPLCPGQCRLRPTVAQWCFPKPLSADAQELTLPAASRIVSSR